MWLFFELQAMAAVHSLERSLNTAKGKFEALLDVMLCWNPVVTLSSVWPLIIGIQVIILFMIVVSRSDNFEMSFWCHHVDQNRNENIN